MSAFAAPNVWPRPVSSPPPPKLRGRFYLALVQNLPCHARSTASVLGNVSSLRDRESRGVSVTFRDRQRLFRFAILEAHKSHARVDVWRDPRLRLRQSVKRARASATRRPDHMSVGCRVFKAMKAAGIAFKEYGAEIYREPFILKIEESHTTMSRIVE